MESTMMLCFFIVHGSLSSYVQLKGPESSIKNSEILLNCTSTIPPVGLFAEFLLNGRSYTSIRSSQGMCLTGPLDVNCNYQYCSCSVEGFWFAFRYLTVSNISELLFTCVMKFGDVGERSDIQRTRILDIEGPYIISSDNFPMPSGISTSLICKAIAKNVEIKLAWTCPVLYLKALSNEVANSTIYISTLRMKSSSIYNGINCSCLLTAGEYFTSTTIKLDVNNSPVLKISGETACSSTSTLTLTCEVSGDLAMYGFMPWIHSYKGAFIREINGSIGENISAITLERCNYQDTGNYTCIAWNLHESKTFWTNKTTIMEVQERPVVVDSEIISDLAIYLSMKFYSIAPPTSVQWYHLRKLINSSSEASETSILIFIYNTRIKTLGYFVNMTLLNHRRGTYAVVVGNDYGKTTHEFEIMIKGATHKLTAVLWILTSVVVFIVTVSMTALFMKRRYSGGLTSNNAAVIYHAAPCIENQVRLYDLPDCRNEEYEDNGTSEYIDAIYVEVSGHAHYEEIL